MRIRGFAASYTVAIAVALAASLALADSASATVHHLTYTGVVNSAHDDTGEFGAGANLIGQAFTAQVLYDDAKPGTTHVGDVYYDFYVGQGAANPVAVTIFLNGVTKTFGATSGQDLRMDRTLQPGCMFSCTDASFEQSAEDRFVLNGIYTLNYINLGGLSSDGTLSGIAHTAPNYTNPPLDLYGYVNLSQQDTSTLETLVNTGVGVRIDSVVDREFVAPAVPEPGVWALMLMGFGAVGGLLRRRRAAAFAPA